MRSGDKKIMGLYLQVSKSLELAGIKTARDFRNVQVIGVEHWSSCVNQRVASSGQGSQGSEARSGRVAAVATDSVKCPQKLNAKRKQNLTSVTALLRTDIQIDAA